MTLHILDIPIEILLLIFSRLPSQTLVKQIPLVCKQFRDLVATPWYWKTHYVRLSGSQPLKDYALLREWQEGCILSEFAVAGMRGDLTTNFLTGEENSQSVWVGEFADWEKYIVVITTFVVLSVCLNQCLRTVHV